jgi:hypothetical protein
MSICIYSDFFYWSGKFLLASTGLESKDRMCKFIWHCEILECNNMYEFPAKKANTDKYKRIKQQQMINYDNVLMI